MIRLDPVITATTAGCGLAVFLMVWVLMPRRARGLLERRLGSTVLYDATQPGVDPDDLELRRPFAQRVVGPLIARVGTLVLRATPQGQIEKLRSLIAQAGSPRRPEAILTFQFIAVPIGGLLGLALVQLLGVSAPLSIGVPVLLAGVGYLLPASSLKRAVRKRAGAIGRQLPGVLDLLTVSMEAGLSFDMALLHVDRTESGELRREIHKVLNEMRLGRPRQEALMAMAERNRIEELTAFVHAVVQAEPLGVSVANVLRIQGEELRRLRRQRAEEAGHRAPVLMLLPMLGCIFPCVFIMLLGPALLSVMHSFSGH